MHCDSIMLYSKTCFMVINSEIIGTTHNIGLCREVRTALVKSGKGQVPSNIFPCEIFENTCCNSHGIRKGSLTA